MKLINYDTKNRRLYISRPLVVALIISGLTILGLFIFWLIFVFSFYQTQYSFENRQLGEAPPGLQNAADPQKAADALARIKEKKYGSTFNILYFLDGYKNSEDGVAYTKTLTAALSEDPYFKNLLPQISTTIFTSEGQKCFVEKENLVCDADTMNAFQRLGVKHMKAVILSPFSFNLHMEKARGKNSFITISTKSRNDVMSQQFLDGLKKSISLDLISPAQQEQYLNGVIYCFYGGKESYIFPDGKFNSCSEFMKKYPKFWEE